MPIRKDIENAIHDAMRNRDESKLRVLRLLLSAIKMADVEKGIPIDDAMILSLVQKEIKIRLDSIKDAETAGRSQMIEQNQQEAKLLESYLPKQLSESELTKIIEETLSEVQAHSPADMGRVMKVLMPKVQGQAPNALISQIVRKLLEKTSE